MWTYDTIGFMTWPMAIPLDTPRLRLEPLSVRHAHEMVAALAPRELYTFIGGEPPTEAALQTRYLRQSIGHSPAGDAGWLNWIIRRKATHGVAGYVQATLTGEAETLTAEIAWLVVPSAQRGGVATEATAAMLDWLHQQQVAVMRALIHPAHHASMRVAQRLGMESTTEVVDGEAVWELRAEP